MSLWAVQKSEDSFEDCYEHVNIFLCTYPTSSGNFENPTSAVVGNCTFIICPTKRSSRHSGPKHNPADPNADNPPFGITDAVATILNILKPTPASIPYAQPAPNSANWYKVSFLTPSLLLPQAMLGVNTASYTQVPWALFGLNMVLFIRL